MIPCGAEEVGVRLAGGSAVVASFIAQRIPYFVKLWALLSSMGLMIACLR